MGGRQGWLDARMDREQGRTCRAIRHRTDRRAAMSLADAWNVADPTLSPTCKRESCEEHVSTELGNARPAARTGHRTVHLPPASAIKPRPVRWLWDHRLPLG